MDLASSSGSGRADVRLAGSGGLGRAGARLAGSTRSIQRLLVGRVAMSLAREPTYQLSSRERHQERETGNVPAPADKIQRSFVHYKILQEGIFRSIANCWRTH